MRTLACIARLALVATLLAPASASAQSADALFDDTVLHEIRLLVHSADWAALKADFASNVYYPADLEWQGQKVRNIGIRSRGRASRNGLKPGLRLDMNRYASGQRFLGLRSIVLDNAYTDLSQMRDRIAMKLFARLGLTPPRLSHARLFVNGEYAGLYVITEELGEDFVRRVFHKPDADEPDKGTLFEYHWAGEWRFEYLGEDFQPYRERFEARTRESTPDTELYAPFEALSRAVAETPPDRLLEDVDRWIDVRQFVRYAAVDTYLVDHDGLVGFKGMANFYVYRPEDSTRLSLLPWDKDQAFYQADRSIWEGTAANVLLAKAMDAPELRTLYLDTLDECARVSSEGAGGGGLGWMEAEIARGVDQTRLEVPADPGRWFSIDDYYAEIDRMRAFARTRAPFVQCQVANDRHPDRPQTCAAPNQTPLGF